RSLSNSDPLLWIAATFCATVIFLLRARRWLTILEPVAGKLSLGALWRATAIGMMVNNVVPARAGEIARAYALTRESPVPFATSLASLAVDRLFDAVVLLLLGLSALIDPALSASDTLAGRPLSSFATGAGTLVFVLLA